MVDPSYRRGDWSVSFQCNRKNSSMQFCLYRRYMKKKISFEMQSRVDDMVSKYI